jgi:hypothetical protein
MLLCLLSLLAVAAHGLLVSAPSAAGTWSDQRQLDLLLAAPAPAAAGSP